MIESTEQSKRPRGRKNFKVLEGGEALGRTLPYSIEAEEYLLSAMMLDDGATVAMAQRSKLRPEHFYSPANRVVAKTIFALHGMGRPVDSACVAEELQSSQQLEAVGGYAYVGQISGRLPTTAQAHYFLDKVIELAILRRMIREGTEAVEACFNFPGDLAGFTGGIAGKFTAIADYVMGRTRRVTQSEAAALARAEAIEVAEGRVDKSRWLHWPWPTMDAGFLPIDTRQEDWFSLVAAPPSGGKSTFLRILAGCWLGDDKRGVIFLLETSRKRWLQALAASFAGLNLRNLEEEKQLYPKKFAEFTVWMETIEEWMEDRLWVFDDVTSLEDIVRVTRELHRTLREKEIAAGVPEDEAQGLHFLVGDYLQIVTTRRQFLKRTEELAHICRTLKLFHRQSDLPGFWGAQITRAARHEGRRPTLADLGESKALEESADRVQFVHEPTDSDGPVMDAEQSLIKVEIIQRKSRNGPKDVVCKLDFNRRLSRMEDPTRKQPVPGDGIGRGVDFAKRMNPGKISKGDFLG